MTLFLTLLACFPPTEDTFAAQVAQVGCNRANECSKGAFQYAYDDMAECVDEATELWECYESCDFDEDKAASCLEDLRTIECGDQFEAALEGDFDSDCYEVYDCEDDDSDDADECRSDILD